MPDQPALMDHLRSPFEPADLRFWDGAVTREERNASIWLYDAIVSGNTNLIRAMLDAGARVNTVLYSSALPLDTLPRSPLGLAWWLQTHHPSGEETFPRGPGPDGEVLRDNGVVPLLLEAGASPDPDLLRTLTRPQWEQVRQPSFYRMEAAILGHLRERNEVAVQRMVLTPSRRDRLADDFLFNDSVVPATDSHEPHLWLHRAIVRRDWAAVHGWLDLGGVVSTSDTHAVLVTMWSSLTAPAGRPRPGEAADADLQALAAVRARLLDEPETYYRGEVTGLLRQLGVVDTLPPGGQKGWDLCDAWTRALVAERPLATFQMQAEDRALLSAAQATALQRRLIALEQGLLRRQLADATPPRPVAAPLSRPRL